METTKVPNLFDDHNMNVEDATLQQNNIRNGDNKAKRRQQSGLTTIKSLLSRETETTKPPFKYNIHITLLLKSPELLNENYSLVPPSSKCSTNLCFKEKIFLQSLYNVVDSVPETNPLIVYLRDVEKLLESERIYKFFLILLNKISGPVLILGSKVLVPEDDIQQVGERVSALFPCNIEIRPHEDESHLLSWKNRLEEDTKMVQLTRTKVSSLINLNIIASLKGCKRVCMFDALALACHNK
ncbi:hypothetical protein Bca4012_085904 [Brassica carinata]